MSESRTPQLNAHIRRLSSDGARLYVRFEREDLDRSQLSHELPIELVFANGASIAGIVKTSGATPWLAPLPDSSNEAITKELRKAGFEHGDDVSAVVRVRGAARLPIPTRNVPEPQQPMPRASTPSALPVVARRIDARSAALAVQNYNTGRYRGRANVDVDRIAYDSFRHGMPDDPAALTELVRLVGEDYGGAQRRFLPHGYREEAALIAANLKPRLPQWRAMVAAARPLAEAVPDEAMLATLLAPFAGSKRWPVWASKTLHFLRPDAFPILDSRAKAALGLAKLGSSPNDYHRFCSAFQYALGEHRAALDAARRVDGGTSPSDLKLLDKILYELGGEDGGAASTRLGNAEGFEP